MSSPYAIKRWISQVPRRQWQKEEDQWLSTSDAIPAVVREYPALAEVHRLDLSLFVIFEEAALRVSGALTRHAPDIGSMNFCAEQTLNEARHLEMFQTRLTLAALAQGKSAQPAQSIMSPPLKRFIAHVYKVVDGGDFVAGLTLMNLIFEGLAYPLYAYEERYWQGIDPYLAGLVHSAFVDESRHVGHGARLVKQLLADDTAKRASVRNLCLEATQAMTEVFDYYVRSFVGLFDAVAKRHGELFLDAEFSPGRKFSDTPYEEQVRGIQESMKIEHDKILLRAGLVDT